ncbi:MAG: hypothetical protein AAFN70_11260 [Planctomycetota bacterium]
MFRFFRSSPSTHRRAHDRQRNGIRRESNPRKRDRWRRRLSTQQLEDRRLLTFFVDPIYRPAPPIDLGLRPDDVYVIAENQGVVNLDVLDNDTYHNRFRGVVDDGSMDDSSADLTDGPFDVSTGFFGWLGGETITRSPETQPVPLRITSVSQPDSGSVEISNDQQHLIFHAGTNFTGTLTFEYTAQRTEQNVDTGSIGNAETEITATVNILVAPPLYAGDDFAGTADGSAVVANVLDNDMEYVRHFDLGPLKAYGNHDYRRQLKITGIGIAANGTVEIGQDARSIRYPHDR